MTDVEPDDDDEAPIQTQQPRRRLFERTQTVLGLREQQAAYVLGALTAVLSLVGWIPKAIDESRSEGYIYAAIGLVFGILFILAARTRRRLLTAFASLLANFAQSPWRYGAFVSFACVVLGGLIILRTSNEAARLAGEERRRKREEQRTAARDRPARGRRGSSSTSARPAGPTASKRYTPPKPKPKPRTPPPSKSKSDPDDED